MSGPLSLDLLLRQVAAVDDDAGACHVCSRFAGQKDDWAFQFIGLAPAAQGGVVAEGLLLRFAEQAHGQVGQEWPWGDAVDGDAKWADIHRTGSGHAKQP